MDDILKVRVVPGRELSADLCAHWSQIQSSNPTLGSPYFCPEFTQTVAAVRTDVEVAVLERDNQIVGFFPYQRGRWANAQPVAGRLTDFHGLIVGPDFACDPIQLLHQCGLSSWRFDHLIESQTYFQPFMWTHGLSPYIDLSAGFSDYLAERRQRNSELPMIARKLRKLEREVGPVRFEWHSTSAENLQTLFQWKSAQFARTGLRDLLSFAWIRDFFAKLLEQNGTEFAGLFSCLHAGDQLLAAHVGMRSRNVMHWWLPSFNRDFVRYSPGLALIYRFAQQASEHGITRIDLGQGDEAFKFRLGSAADPVAEGSVDVLLRTRLFHRSWQATRDWVRTSPLNGPTERPLRWIRRMRDWLRFR
ncbi:GNAT family N-acetyltransferase [Anatilimnocola sp. NA78]|uniref:GNAT family N-acetyltransferase n=1 Tax=Anatilimnocola sp. NA78 TaxID=3415683 RepID=UPI003CE4E911